MNLKQITDDLVADLDGLTFGPPVTHVYNPLIYARKAWDMYCEKYGQGKREVLCLGMNPGPFGMSQCGVPFGEIAHVRDWLGIETAIGKPPVEHPKRPVLGFDCTRSEVSGRRLWSWAKETYGTPEAFFERFFVWNHCPLAFLEEGGRNRTPDKLPVSERDALMAICDAAVQEIVETLAPRHVIGVGAFALRRARSVLGEDGPALGTILHPSPASPAANRGWREQIEIQLRDLGLDVT